MAVSLLPKDGYACSDADLIQEDSLIELLFRNKFRVAVLKGERVLRMLLLLLGTRDDLDESTNAPGATWLVKLEAKRDS